MRAEAPRYLEVEGVACTERLLRLDDRTPRERVGEADAVDLRDALGVSFGDERVDDGDDDLAALVVDRKPAGPYVRASGADRPAPPFGPGEREGLPEIDA